MAAGITFSKDLQGREIVKIDLRKYGNSLMDFFRENQMEDKAHKYIVKEPTAELMRTLKKPKVECTIESKEDLHNFFENV